MKKIVLALLVQAFALTTFAQSEPFVKALKKLEYGSTILDAAMLFKRDFPDFESMTQKPVFITAFTNPYDASQTFRIEAFYMVNRKDQELVQLYYVNDELYEKSVYWFYPTDSVKAVETKYMKCNNAFVSNPALLAAEKGSVKHKEEKYAQGRKTVYPVQKVGKDERIGYAGYELVYTGDTGARGFWVYAQILSTMNNGLDNSMEFPRIAPPKGTYDELEQVLLVSEQ